MSKEQQIEDAIRNAKASLEVEGQSLPQGGEELIRKTLSGEISDKEFLRQARDLARHG